MKALIDVIKKWWRYRKLRKFVPQCYLTKGENGQIILNVPPEIIGDITELIAKEGIIIKEKIK